MEVTPSKYHLWKEELMSKILEELMTRIDTINTEEEYKKAVAEVIVSLKRELNNTANMIADTTSGIPLSFLKKNVK